ncbi:MAG: flagellin [Bryobacteraceae bacterium]|jgi:flagellar hook-associated protein 3 FlgL
MTANLDGASELFLVNVERIQDRIAEASRQVSSGKKIEVASDAPDSIEPLLQLRAEQQRNTQIQSNLGLAQTDADTADSTLANAIKLMDRAQTLATEGASDTLDASGRQALASEVQSLQQEMVSCSQTMVAGHYIFSGDLDTSPSYQLDPAAADGVDELSTASATRQIEDPAGGAFPSSMTAQAIFDSRNPDGSFAPDNVFAALSALQTALQTGTSDDVATAASSIQQASVRLNSAEAFYGTVERRIQDAQSYAGAYDTQLQTQLSQTQDADVASAALTLSQANTQLQAAFQMRASLPTRSLFDYLG